MYIDRYCRELDSSLSAAMDWYEYQYARYLNDTSVDLRANYDVQWQWNLGWGAPQDPDLDKPGYVNAIKSVIDTLVAKIADQKVRPYFTPINATWETKKVVRNVQQYFDVLFDKMKIGKLNVQAFKAACIFGKAHVFINPLTYKLSVLPAFCVQTLLSEERYTEKTRALVRYLNFPTHMLKDYGLENYDYKGNAFHVTLRHFFDTQNHKQVVYVNDDVAFEGEYSPDVLPFTTIYYNDPVFGGHLTSVVKELDGIQTQINYINDQISQAMQRDMIDMFFVSEGSSLAPKDLSNKAGMVFGVKNPPGQNQPPVTQVTPRICDPQWIELQKMYLQQAYDIVGVSQLSAMSKKPAGLDSGVALQTMENIEGDRFQVQVDNFVHMFVDLANTLIAVLPKDKDVLPASYNNSSIKWKDVKKQFELFKVQYSAQSALSKDPQEKIKQILQLSQVGLITPDKISQYLDQPDLEDAYKSAAAVADGVNQCIERAIEDGDFEIPDWVNYQLLAKQITITENELYASINDNEKADKLVVEALKNLRQLEENLFATMQVNGFVENEEQQEAEVSESGIGVAPDAVQVNDISSEVEGTQAPAQPESLANPQETGNVTAADNELLS